MSKEKTFATTSRNTIMTLLRFILFHRRLCYLTSFVWACIICALLWFPWNRKLNKAEVIQDIPTQPRLLLRWNYDVARPNVWQLSRTNVTTSYYCGTKACTFTSNRTAFPEAHVLLFYGSHFDYDKLPIPRKPEQLWALFHEESPRNNPLLLHESVLQHFNFSSTFSRYSDFPLTTSFLQNIEDLTTLDYVVSIHQKAILRQNLAPILYLQSDCFTMTARDEYVRDLMKHIEIDSYGDCLHNRNLPNSLRQDYLNNMYSPEMLHFMAQYKFVIGIENGVCDDYITEKFWRPLIVGSIPIYLGSPTIRDWEPNNPSAIYISEFAGPQELATFLIALDKNNTEYNKYLNHKYDKTQPIANSLLLKELVNSATYDDTFSHFECAMCKNLYSLRPGDVHVVKKNHYQCELPCKDNEYNKIHSVGKCRADLLDELLQKNEHFVEQVLNNMVAMNLADGKCENYNE